MATVCLRHREKRSQTHIFPVNFLLCTNSTPETLCKCTLKPWQWQVNSIYLNLLSSRSQSITFSCTPHCPKGMPWNTCSMSAVTGQFMKPLNLDLCLGSWICYHFINQKCHSQMDDLGCAAWLRYTHCASAR